MPTTVTTTKEEFLSDCNADDRAAYEKLFADLEDLARELGDPNPADAESIENPLEGQPLRLRVVAEEKKGAALMFRHDKLKQTTPLLWFFPSDNEARWSAVNRVSAMLGPVIKAGVRAEDATRYGAELQKANFVSGGSRVLKTSTAGESTGVSRIFRWDRNRAEVVRAVRTLVERVQKY
jgi:hypothetical protein